MPAGTEVEIPLNPDTGLKLVKPSGRVMGLPSMVENPLNPDTGLKRATERRLSPLTSHPVEIPLNPDTGLKHLPNCSRARKTRLRRRNPP